MIKRQRTTVLRGETAVPDPWAFLAAAGRADLRALADQVSQSDVLQLRWQRRLRGALLAGSDHVDAAAVQLKALLSNPAHVERPGERGLRRQARHDVANELVMLGQVAPHPRNDHRQWEHRVRLPMEYLKTSALVIGSPGSGKTRNFATPIVESLALASLADGASVVVVDVKGDDFAWPGFFDVEVDLRDPSAVGLSLFDEKDAPDVAADRLASALVPDNGSADKQYFTDAAKNALFYTVAAYQAAHNKYPGVRELLNVLTGDGPTIQSLEQRLRNRGRKDELRYVLARKEQQGRRDDAAASLIERLRLLDRPGLVELFSAKRRFAMGEINQPVRVRIALDEAHYPLASAILAKLVVAQFVQTTSSSSANRGIFKGLVIDEAGRYIDEYAAQGVKRIRSNNAGLVMLTQSLEDIAESIRSALFGSVGNKVVFAGMNPTDAKSFADWWGTVWEQDVTQSRQSGQSAGTSSTGPLGPTSTSEGLSQSSGHSSRLVERARWSLSDLVNGIPMGHAVASFASPAGERTPPVLINMRS